MSSNFGIETLFFILGPKFDEMVNKYEVNKLTKQRMFYTYFNGFIFRQTAYIYREKFRFSKYLFIFKYSSSIWW